jgi:UDP-N-acetylglucosamine 2-epimerase (non-hydrolysing)
VLGTRPEAIKMAPVVRALARHGDLQPVVVSSGQHAELLQSALVPLGLRPDHDLGVMTADQSLSEVTARVLDRLPPLLRALGPAALLVQGDTTTALAAALAAFQEGVAVGHVEAGLRSHDLAQPFPEEANRQLIDRLCRWCFAPTERSVANLLAERIDPGIVHRTGNTAVDSLLWALEQSPSEGVEASEPPFVLLTLHRRESFGEPLREILAGLGDFLEVEMGAHAVWPVHPNPAVLRAAERCHPRVERVAPVDYLGFARLLRRARVVLTDSGGIQEEGPSLGKPVLVARDVTERPEGIESGHNRLVGRTRGSVAGGLREAWAKPRYRGAIPAPNPYGDGRAAERIVDILRRDLL